MQFLVEVLMPLFMTVSICLADWLCLSVTYNLFILFRESIGSAFIRIGENSISLHNTNVPYGKRA